MNIIDALQKRMTTRQSGQILIIVLIMLALIGVVIIPLMNFLNTGIKNGTMYENRTSSLFAADAGVRDAIWQLNNPTFNPTYIPTTVSVPGHTYTLSPIRGFTPSVTISLTNTSTLTYEILSNVTKPGTTPTLVTSFVRENGGIFDKTIRALTGDINLSNGVDIASIPPHHGDIAAGGNIILGTTTTVDGTQTPHDTYTPPPFNLSQYETDAQVITTSPVYSPSAYARGGSIPGSARLSGPLTLNGNLTVNGNLYIDGYLSLNGALTVNGSLYINGYLLGSNNANLNVGGNVGGKLYVNGYLNFNQNNIILTLGGTTFVNDYILIKNGCNFIESLTWSGSYAVVAQNSITLDNNFNCSSALLFASENGNMSINNNANGLEGYFYAPNGNINIDNNNIIVGSLVAQSINIANNTKLTFEQLGNVPSGSNGPLGLITYQIGIGSSTPTPTAFFNPTSGPVGTSIVVNGNGWVYSENISNVTVDSTNATNTLSVDSTGNLSGTITVPSITTGSKTIVITGASSGAQPFTNAFTVMAIGATFTPNSGPVGTLINVVGSGWSPSETISNVTVGGIVASNTLMVNPLGNMSGIITDPSTIITGGMDIVITGTSSGAKTFSNAFTVTTATAAFNPTSGPVGANINVTGTGWGISDVITGVIVGGTPATQTLSVDTSGNLSGTITVPSITLGVKSIVITGASSGAQTFNNAFTVTSVPDASKSKIIASPTPVPADGSTISTITVTLLDSGNNPVSGKTVSLAQGSGHSTISAASGPSNSSGVVTFTVSNATAEAVTYTASDSTDSITITQKAIVTFKGAQTINISSNTNWSSITSGSGIGGQPSSLDTVNISGNATLTVDVTNGVAGTIYLGTAINQATTLSFNANTKVTVGNLNHSGNKSSSNTIDMTNGGTLNITGSVIDTGLSFTSGTGTVEYGGTTQTTWAKTYNNLTLSGSGAKTINSGTAVSRNLSIAPTGTATATLTAHINANTLTLGGALQTGPGTWGGTGSGAGHINTTYFNAASNGNYVTAAH